jgi:hypothetical protein
MRIALTKQLAHLGGLILCFAAASVSAQTPDSTAAHATHAVSAAPTASTDTEKVQQELARLRDQVRQLEQRMQAAAPAKAQQSGGMTMGNQSKGSMAQSAQAGMKMARMGMMDDDMDMPMKDSNAGSSMSGASGGGMRMMEMMRSKMGDDQMMGMGAMGGMNSPAAMATPSALPGFPGQSHLYHIGATGFFLDHPQHIALTAQQQQMLANHKQQSLLKQGELQRQIDAAEEKLWQLTSADQPQIDTINKQVREIERLRADQRIAFIRAVGEAAKALTDQQRMQLTGMAQAQSSEPAPMATPDSNPSKSDSMGHM